MSCFRRLSCLQITRNCQYPALLKVVEQFSKMKTVLINFSDEMRKGTKLAFAVKIEIATPESNSCPHKVSLMGDVYYMLFNKFCNHAFL